MTKKIVSRKTKEKSTLKLQGIYENGYGIVPKKIMIDTRITGNAKLIYSFLCTFCGNGTTAYPSVEYQCKHLPMSKDTYYKHRQLLVDYGYLKIEQKREVLEYEDGTTKEIYSNNVYTIVTNIEKEFLDKELPKNKTVKNKKTKPRTSKSADITKEVQCPKISDTDKANSPKVQCPKNYDTEKQDSNNNNLNNNSLNNNNLNNSSSSTKDIYNTILNNSKEHEEEETILEKDLKTLMAFCNKYNYKLTTIQAKSFLETYGLEKVKQGITNAINGSKEPIKYYANYLTKTLKDLTTPKNINVNVTKTGKENKTNTFANFTQREYDYNKLEKQLLGWGDNEDYEEED